MAVALHGPVDGKSNRVGILTVTLFEHRFSDAALLYIDFLTSLLYWHVGLPVQDYSVKKLLHEWTISPMHLGRYKCRLQVIPAGLLACVYAHSACRLLCKQHPAAFQLVD
jgi:hypothetical protein